jgi:hypothetical protein
VPQDGHPLKGLKLEKEALQKLVPKKHASLEAPPNHLLRIVVIMH